MSVGALAPNTETALAIGPVVMVLSTMLGGSGGLFAELPDFMKPAARLSLIKWGFDGCMGAEFTGATFHCDDVAELAAGKGAKKRPKISTKQAEDLGICVRTGAKVSTKNSSSSSLTHSLTRSKALNLREGSKAISASAIG